MLKTRCGSPSQAMLSQPEHWQPMSARLRKSVRIVSSKQVFSPGDEEEGESLHNLRIEVGRNSQPRVNREMHPPQGSD